MNIFGGRFKLKRVGIMMAASLLIISLVGGCGKVTDAQTTTPTAAAVAVKDSIVQVWIGDNSGGTKTFESLGVPVGDGTTVLTVIDYEDFTPGEAEVRTQDNKTFSATIQAIDARTGATLLNLDSGKLTPVATRDPAGLKVNEPLTFWAQNNSDPAPTETGIIGNPSTNPLDFEIGLPGGGFDTAGLNSQGGVVSDRSGKVLGLEGVSEDSFTLMIGFVGELGYIPPVISITSASELLTPNANQQLWANGPLILLYSFKNGNHGYFDISSSNYPSIANDITQVLNELGGPVALSDLPQYFPYASGNQNSNQLDGSLLTAVFPRPVNLYGADGTVLAQAKWVSIQWGRSDNKQSLVVYGSTAYTAEGGFEITGDTASLASIMLATINNPNGQ
jgi:hypothetical protein